MNKLLPAIFTLILSACSTEPLKITEPADLAANSQPSQKNRNNLWDNPDNWGVYDPRGVALQNNTRTRHHTVLHFNNDDVPQETSSEESILAPLGNYLKQGIASWYGPGFHGKKTANGEIYDMYAMTAAHKTLPIDSYVEVVNLENNRKVVVRINDRGPYHGNRLVDLSYAAAKELDIAEQGKCRVELKVVSSNQALPQLQEAAVDQDKDIYLQIASFGSVKKALKLQNKLVAHHLPEPAIRRSGNKKSAIYKVQIGPIDSTSNADKLNQQLAAIGITDTEFVTETQQIQNAMLQ